MAHVNLKNDGLTVWYDTPDAPAPPHAGVSRRGSVLTIGVRPPSPSNAVLIRYRMDGKVTRDLPARELRTDYASQTQYFQAAFPPFPDGDVVEYTPILSCAGRQVPAPGTEQFASSFRLVNAVAKPIADSPRLPNPSPAFAPGLEFIANMTVHLRKPEVIGPCPDGLRINYTVESGTVVGPGLNAKIRPGGCDSMIIQRNGVGLPRVRIVIETDEGALIAAEYEGVLELGEGGYEKALLGQFPERPLVQLAPRLHTAHPKYLWANRAQFIAIGHAIIAELRVEYDLYVVHTDRFKAT